MNSLAPYLVHSSCRPSLPLLRLVQHTRKAGKPTQLNFSSTDIFPVPWSCSSCVLLRGCFRVLLLGHGWLQRQPDIQIASSRHATHHPMTNLRRVTNLRRLEYTIHSEKGGHQEGNSWSSTLQVSAK